MRKEINPADELFKYVWPFCGVGASTVKAIYCHLNLSKHIAQIRNYKGVFYYICQTSMMEPLTINR